MDEIKFGVFIQYETMVKAQEAAEAFKQLFPERQVEARDFTSRGPAQSLLEKRIIDLKLARDRSTRHIAVAVRRWFKEEKGEPRNHVDDFTYADLLTVPVSYLLKRSISQRDIRMLKRLVEEEGLQLNEQ